MLSLFNPTLMGRPQRMQFGGLGELMQPQGLDPMAMQSTQPMIQPQARPRGLSLDNFRTNLRDILSPEIGLQVGGEMMAGKDFGDSLSRGFSAMGQGVSAKKQERKAEAERNRTLEWLRTKDPKIAEAVEMGILPIGEVYNAMSGGNGKATDDMREYAMAIQQGYQGSFMDYQKAMKEAGRNQINIETGVKLPGGYEWVDPNDQAKGVRPIKGGPATQMPAELAARIGMADSFLGQLPAIKKQVATGEVTGPIDKTLAAVGYGPGGQTYRQIQSGVDALMRLLTGAGMNQTEAEQYARRYLPTYMDDANTVSQKLDQLERELRSAKEMATRGRVAEPSEDGWQDLGGGVRIRQIPGG